LTRDFSETQTKITISVLIYTVKCKKKVDKKFSAAWSSLPVFRFWLAAVDYDCILGCLAEYKKTERKLSVLENPHLYNNILRKNNCRKLFLSTFFFWADLCPTNSFSFRELLQERKSKCYCLCLC
jgi:hypothetical protein